MHQVTVIPHAEEYKYYDQLHREKYRDKNQTKLEHFNNIAHNLGSDAQHSAKLFDSLKYHRFLPAGRVQAAMGATEREVSPFNCSVSQHIDDDIDSIFAALHNAAKILRLGTGIGYNFSTLRPSGALISKLQTEASGPLSFMRVFDAMARCISSSGHRRGAQMGIMNVDHPDIEDFITAKTQKDAFRQFNLSVGITDKFMHAVARNSTFPLAFRDVVYKEVQARVLWDKIVRTAYDTAEPGIIFIDRLNDTNNLFYCETIEATNPCAEQPLPPYGLCTLGSFNLVGYLRVSDSKVEFNEPQFKEDIHAWVEAYDNLFDKANYAIPEHETEAKSKRRIGLGLTGIANAIEYLVGHGCYGEPTFNSYLEPICATLRNEAYRASINLAKNRGPFSLYKDSYMASRFVETLPDDIQNAITKHGIRNSHLISYAPCGTISQCAYNVSSGVEPVFHHKVVRDVYMQDGKVTVPLHDFNVRQYGFYGKTLEECSIDNHMEVARICQKYCDSAVSKTVNVASNCTYEDYSQVYIQAHKLGLKGITVYRPSDLRGIVIASAKDVDNAIKNTSPSGCATGQCSL